MPRYSLNRIILSLFLSGLFLGSGPCLATCGPILVSYIAATRQSLKQGMVVWLLFSLSRICIYLILSISIFGLGEFLVRQRLINIAKYVYSLGGAVIILIGI
ncbi:MAG: sulfite exporter TauE/SafE family protein, partial [Candidatus Omnitrophota bacterium]